MRANESSRRVFRRRAVEVEVRIRFRPPASVTKTGETEGLTLIGRTRDISETGIALFVSAKNIDRYLTRTENSLEVELRLPNGAVALQAVPVYFKKLSSEGVGTYLIGARFTTVPGQQIALLSAFLRSLPPARTNRDK